MKLQDAEAIALEGLAWLMRDEDRATAFLSATGCGAEALRDRLADPAFLGGVLDFLLQDDQLVLGFSADQGIAPDLPGQARASLPGGDLPHWT